MVSTSRQILKNHGEQTHRDKLPCRFYPSKMMWKTNEHSDTFGRDARGSSAAIKVKHRKRARLGRRSVACRYDSPLFFLLVCFIGGSLLDNVPLLQNCSQIPLLFLVSAEERDNEDPGRTATVVMRNPASEESHGIGSPPNSRGSPAKTRKTLSLNEIFVKAGRRGIGGGVPGAIAGVVQVVTLMWLRTIMSYQCRYGTTFFQALTTLLNEGGIARLYKGWYLGLIQAPVTRFVSTAANDGVDSLLSNVSWTKAWGPGRSTFLASIFVGLFRMVLMPIDTMKVVLQVDGAEGFRSLLRRLRAGKVSVLYQGCLATALASMMGHYPWFFTYNWLSAREWVRKLVPSRILRNASIGLVASVVSDVVVNAIRVVKTTKQSIGSRQAVTYAEAVRIVIAADGWRGLFGRGLSTRIYCNALQSIVFTVIWRSLAERWQGKKDAAAEAIK